MRLPARKAVRSVISAASFKHNAPASGLCLLCAAAEAQRSLAQTSCTRMPPARAATRAPTWARPRRYECAVSARCRMRHVHVLGELATPGAAVVAPRRRNTMTTGASTPWTPKNSQRTTPRPTLGRADSSADSAADAAPTYAPTSLLPDRLRGRLPEHRVGGRPLLPRIVGRER